MKFTTATKPSGPQLTIVFRSMNLNYSFEVFHSSRHIKDSEVKQGLKDSGFDITQNRGPSYTVTGGTRSELRQVEEELKVEYGLIEAVDNALLSRIAIEIAIGAAKTDSRRQSLKPENFPPGFDAIKASQTDGFIAICVETSRSILEILK